MNTEQLTELQTLKDAYEQASDIPEVAAKYIAALEVERDDLLRELISLRGAQSDVEEREGE